jgi:hypothetical protein
MTNHRDQLAAIRSFPSLVKYLRDEMGWPIGADSFEDLTFDYAPEELGIDPKNAAKIEEIKRLRPLASGQPWGIFFVKFEPKRLPVVALRRILSQVVLKKRATAKAAELAAWAADDLLFISNYGEGDARHISFAHFSMAEGGTDLPTLKVLGWDNLDTPLHLGDVADRLKRNLSWPSDEEDAKAWRQAWRGAFALQHREVITTSQALSVRLAELARAIRDRIGTALAIETENGPLSRLMKAFQGTLVHDLDAESFADMYAQTIAYGLLSSRIANPKSRTADDFAAHMRTNPLLRELMQTFIQAGGRRGRTGGREIDFDELGVSEVVGLLDQANMEAVLRDFGDRNPLEDPVIHFYELFLKEYDAKKRMQRGVFYTPRPVVSYIIRSVDELLRTEFGLTDGLADTTSWGEMANRHRGLKIPEGVSSDQDFIQILDPATGTGTFLVEVIDLIHKTLVTKWKAEGHGDKKIDALWNEYVPKHLLTRLHGYELLMAPYAIAHLKIGLKLHETGYSFASAERARVYLTNALEPAQDYSGRLEFVLPALAHEVQAVNAVKDKRRFTVTIGNPPYSSQSQNMTDWARGIVDFYFHDDSGRMEERGNRNQLQDDYVKFFRFGQMILDASGIGVLGFISNSSYTRGPWFRGMRYQLMRGFDRISILDLHGSQAHSLDSKEGDQNVFEITTPVAIGLLSKNFRMGERGRIVTYGELSGPRHCKYTQLAAAPVVSLSPLAIAPGTVNQWRFVPHDSTNQDEWAGYVPIPDMFVNWGAGVLTNRNGLAIADSRSEVLRKARRFADLSIPDQEIESEFGFSSNYQWKTGKARQEFAKSPVVDLAESYTFRPLDFQFIYWHKNIVYNMRGNKMEVFRDTTPPIALMFSRNTKHAIYTNIYVTRHIADRHCLEEANVAPLYTPEDDRSLFARSITTRRCNLSESFLDILAKRLCVPRVELLPEEVFHFAYAVFHSPAYRSRYAEFLKIDFPRLPLTGKVELFRALARLGGELAALHLLESPKLTQPITELIGGRTPEVEKISWTKNTVWLDKAQISGFRGVREEVWNFHIGGYQVCEKWLKDRKGRTLSTDDIAHYQRIVVAISETIRLMGEIDAVIDAHGGWPGAFAASEAEG